jgi:UDP-2,4-diacetamido-2,4,6-trideoxy-beta-L-altropyranose hydrolase
MNLMIRADSSSAIGAGHLMRCLALAQASQAEGGQATFLSRCDSPALRQRVTDEGVDLVSLPAAHPDPTDWQTTSRFINGLKPDWLVIDGYHFTPDYQTSARATGVRVLVIDDTAHLLRYDADIVLNQNLGAEKLQYPCDRDTNLLLGTRYVLLRGEFLKWRGWQREIPQEARKVLVTMGGSDPDNVTLTVIKALLRLDRTDLTARIVVGAANPHAESLRKGIEAAKERFELLTNPSGMPELMAWADVAVTAGGSTCWEMALMGLPMLVLTLAENQYGTAEELEAHKAAISLGSAKSVDRTRVSEVLGKLLVDKERRRSLSSQAQRLVDGDGASRVMSVLRGEEACA